MAGQHFRIWQIWPMGAHAYAAFDANTATALIYHTGCVLGLGLHRRSEAWRDLCLFHNTWTWHLSLKDPLSHLSLPLQGRGSLL